MIKKRLPFSCGLVLLLLILIIVTLINLQTLRQIVYTPDVSAQGVHDVAITSVKVSKNNVVQGELVYINVTAQNQGDYTETFNVTAYANTMPIAMPQTINNLSPKTSKNLTFTWNTAAVNEGVYTIKATASIVPSEVDTADNTLINGTVTVRLTATVGTSDFYLSTSLPFQRKAFQANGLHWIFYSDYKNMVYKTSSDGIVWGSPTMVRETLYGYLFSTWFDGTYVHYAYRDYIGIFYRRGLTSASGTITWEPERLAVQGNLWAPNICVDTNGFPWISYRTNYIGTSADTKPYIVKATTVNGSSWGTPKQLYSLDKLWWTVPMPLTSGKVYVLYSYPQGPIYGNLWNDATWLTTPETATPVGSATKDFGSFSSVAKGDDIYLVYLQNFTRNIITLNRTSTGWSPETILITFDPDQIIYPEPPDPLPTISVDSTKGHLYVRWIRLKLYQIRYDATLKEWGVIETPFGTIFNSPDPRSLSSYYQVWDFLVGSVWIEDTASPYIVTYAFQQT